MREKRKEKTDKGRERSETARELSIKEGKGRGRVEEGGEERWKGR